MASHAPIVRRMARDPLERPSIAACGTAVFDSGWMNAEAIITVTLADATVDAGRHWRRCPVCSGGWTPEPDPLPAEIAEDIADWNEEPRW